MVKAHTDEHAEDEASLVDEEKDKSSRDDGALPRPIPADAQPAGHPFSMKPVDKGDSPEDPPRELRLIEEVTPDGGSKASSGGEARGGDARVSHQDGEGDLGERSSEDEEVGTSHATQSSESCSTPVLAQAGVVEVLSESDSIRRPELTPMASNVETELGQGRENLGQSTVTTPSPYPPVSAGLQGSSAGPSSEELLRGGGWSTFSCRSGRDLCRPHEAHGGAAQGSHEARGGMAERSGTWLNEETALYGRRKRKVRAREMPGHASFLQYVFRRYLAIRHRSWVKGGLCRAPVLYRPPCVYGCRNGLALAGEVKWAEQRVLATQVLKWYENYVYLHRRLHSGRTPSALVTFCGEGGVSEGVRRAGGAAHGQDVREQPRYVQRFGRECFSQGDSRSPKAMKVMARRIGAFVTLASPPCKAYSTARMRGEPSEPAMIRETRAALLELGKLHVIENVTGAGSELEGATLLRGEYFGLHVDRPRLFESNFEIHVDAALKAGGDELRRGACLGHRRRWRRLDPFGRPDLHDCCAGNLWAVQGDKPYRCTEAECAAAMGLDKDHMSYAGMTQAIPPAYAQLIFAQACMRDLEREFGVRPILFDEMARDPARCRREMAFLLAGAGEASPHQGVEFSEPLPTVSTAETSGRGGRAPLEIANVEKPRYEPVHQGRHAGGEVALATDETVRVSELRELEYSWAGFFDRCILSPRDVGQADELGWDVSERLLAGGNTLWSGPRRDLEGVMERAAILSVSHPGTRVVVESRGGRDEMLLSRAGFELVRRVRRGEPAYCSAARDARSEHPCSFWRIGREQVADGKEVDYDLLEGSMDPLDRAGAVQEPKTAKAARSYVPIGHEAARWDIGLPSELDQMMAREGVGIHVWDEPGFSEVPFYKFASAEGLMKSIFEADRAILADAMEYVPASEIEAVRRSSTIHPWTIVDQGGGKWRLCHDYSVGTNRVVSTAPFSLPSVWDVLPLVGDDTHFAKYDIRDGFWHCPISPDSRKRLVVRHPGTGRLMWATALPFGYLDSPRLFCGLTEALIERLRRKAASEGVKVSFHVFVDDVLVVGVDKEATRRGMQFLEDEFASRGVQLAPNKTRGPCRCIEFLGLLLANVPGWRGVTLTKKRRDKLGAEIEGWLNLDRSGRQGSFAPKEVASLLGKLVFASQVVPGGRTYMQGMLAAFQGMVVDWRRGTVTFAGQSGRQLSLGKSFWRDLEWWKLHLSQCSFTHARTRTPAGELMLVGTDASDWGTGQVVWRHGGREEHRMAFTAAEKRRSINWRELLGIVRACRACGERARGMTVLVEADNMAAVGAAGKLSSKSADMQVLVHRLLVLSRRHDFVLKVTHTPGEKLDRPDQTSRGDAAEEPRSRLSRPIFEAAQRRVGLFTSYLGAEREHASAVKEGEPTAVALWAHPTYNTVGTALRRMGEKLEGGGGTGAVGMAMVPWSPDAQWFSMLRHSTVVGRFREGEVGVESNVLGEWRRSRFRRPTLVVMFPRTAGSVPRRVGLSYREALDEARGRTEGGPVGYSPTPDGSRFELSVLPGSYAYTMPYDGESVGMLVRICPPADGSDSSAIHAQEAMRVEGRTARKLARGKGLVCDVSFGGPVFRPNPSEMWTVDGFVTDLRGGKTFDRVVFDVSRAHREISSRVTSVSRSDVLGWEMGSDDGSSTAESPAKYEDFELVGRGLEPRAETEADGDEAEREATSDESPAAAALEDVVSELDRLNLARSGANKGPEGRLPRATASVAQAGTEGDRSGAVVQKNQYVGMTCGGCREPFGEGEAMMSHLGALVHPTELCQSMNARAHEERLTAEAGVRGFFAVYSEETGASGVYRSLAEAERWLTDESVRDHAQMRVVGSEEDGHRFIRSCINLRALAGAHAPLPEEGGIAGSATRRVQFGEKMAPARLEKIDLCVSGKCGHVHARDVSTYCRKCGGNPLHMVACAEMSRGLVALGNYVCHLCVAGEMVAEGSIPNDHVLSVALRTMVLKLSQGKETTAASYAAYTSLEEEYVNTMSATMGTEMRLPRHSATAFCAFLSWLATDHNRIRSMEGVMRTAGAMMTKLGLPDVTKEKEVKKHSDELIERLGTEHEPSTAATPRMVHHAVRPGGAIDKRYLQSDILRTREKLQFVMEGVGGCRICEVLGAGESHGLLANEVCILRDPVTGVEVVEAKLEHSKTGFSRFLDLAGTTSGHQIEVAKILRDYWRAAGIPLLVRQVMGLQETRPDFWVVRVSLQGLSSGFSQFERAMMAVKDPRVLSIRAALVARARQRMNGASNDKKYINVVAGRSSDKSIYEIRDVFTNAGINARVVPGPLLMATTGGSQGRVLPMPLAISSAFGPTKEVLTMAWEMANADPDDPDPHLEERRGRAPYWTTHSLRRAANSVARRDMEAAGVTAEEIDIYLGWHERILLKEMQRHYEGLSVRARMQQARITGGM